MVVGQGYKKVLEHCAEVADKIREALERTRRLT